MNNNIIELKKKIRKLIQGEFANDLNEMSTTGCVAGYQTPFAFSSNKKSKGNTKIATKSLPGYKIISNDGKEDVMLMEDTDYNIKVDYDMFVSKLSNSKYNIKKEVVNKLNQKFANKRVLLHGSKGYKQFKKDYTVNVSSVKIEDYYGNYEIILVGNDGKEYFVDRNFKVKIFSDSGSQTSTEQPITPAQQTPPDGSQQSIPTGEQQTNLSKELSK